MTGVLLRGWSYKDRGTQAELVKTEAEIGMIYFSVHQLAENAKDHRLSPEARRESWNSFSFTALRKNQPC